MLFYKSRSDEQPRKFKKGDMAADLTVDHNNLQLTFEREIVKDTKLWYTTEEQQMVKMDHGLSGRGPQKTIWCRIHLITE